MIFSLLESVGPRLDRRAWLRLGPLAGLLGARAVAASPSTPRQCLILFMAGGPSQFETWDPKPDAPAEIRGPFKPIASSIPGYHVGELMPRLARQAHRLAIARALTTADNAHSASGYYVLTARPHTPKNTEGLPPGAPNDAPSLAALSRRLRPGNGPLPPAIILPEPLINNPNSPWPGQDGGWLGRTADPWFVRCQPNAPRFHLPEFALPDDVPSLRADQRSDLRTALDRHLLNVDSGGRFDLARHQALEMLRSPKARIAFDLEAEPVRLRDQYGRHRFGQSVLLARRLLEAGVPFVQVNWPREPGDTSSNAPLWDTHANNAGRMKDVLMPQWDQTFSALLDDLADRGMLEQTLIVCIGEFGRTPQHNGAGGRDHWGHVFSAAFAGAGVAAGAVHGSSDARGAYPRDGAIIPEDLHATIFHLLGIDPQAEVIDPQGRPQAIYRGRVVSPLVG